MLPLIAKVRVEKPATLAAVTQNGATLKFAPVEMKNDRGIVLAAVKQSGWALEYMYASIG